MLGAQIKGENEEVEVVSVKYFNVSGRKESEKTGWRVYLSFSYLQDVENFSLFIDFRERIYRMKNCKFKRRW